MPVDRYVVTDGWCERDGLLNLTEVDGDGAEVVELTDFVDLGRCREIGPTVTRLTGGCRLRSAVASFEGQHPTRCVSGFNGQANRRD